MRRTRGTNEPNLFRTLRTGFGFSCESSFDSFFFLKFDFGSLVNSHMGENLEIDFQLDFHSK